MGEDNEVKWDFLLYDEIISPIWTEAFEKIWR